MRKGLWLSVRKRLHSAAGDRDMEIEVSMDEPRFIALFGPSGSGKSTLLRMIAGLTAPDDGHISMDGEIWFDSTNKINVHAQKRRVGLVFQDYALFPAMTVEKNISYGIRGPSDKDRMDYLIDAFDLKGLCKRYPETLSGGQKQRIAIARALIARPKVILADEPTGALDSVTSMEVMDILHEINKSDGITMIIVTHEQSIAARTQKTIRISDGVITEIIKN